MLYYDLFSVFLISIYPTTFRGKQKTMAAELVNSATSEKLTEMDWTKNIEICELVARDQRYSFFYYFLVSIFK